MSHSTRLSTPSWTQAYKLGVQLNKQVEHVRTLDEVAAQLGITRQNAYTETCLALGKLAWAMRERFRSAEAAL